jgi:hypothetical protein
MEHMNTEEHTGFRLSQRQRKPVLILHLVCSVGWLGLYAVYILLGLITLTSRDVQTPSVASQTLGWLGTVGIVFSVGALLSGLVISYGTRWGILRYKWVVTKLVITTAMVANDDFITPPRLQAAANSLVRMGITGMVTGVVGGALVIVSSILAVYKPWGLVRRAA